METHLCNSIAQKIHNKVKSSQKQVNFKIKLTFQKIKILIFHKIIWHHA
jgi:hypothetical protein